jgi:hypothetical protein
MTSPILKSAKTTIDDLPNLSLTINYRQVTVTKTFHHYRVNLKCQKFGLPGCNLVLVFWEQR